MSELNLVLIGKHIHSANWKENQLDIPLFERLADSSHRLLIISQGRVKERTVVRVRNIELVLIPVRSFLDYHLYVYSVIKELLQREDRSDWNVLGVSEPIAGGLAAVFLSWWCNIPYMAMVQGDLLSLPSSHFSKLKRFILKRITIFVTTRAQVVRAVSKKIHDDLVVAGIKKEKIYILRNRVDLKRFNSASLESQRVRIRKDLGWDKYQVLVFAGALTVEKGFLDFVNACETLLSEFNDLRVLIIGDGELRRPGEQRLTPFLNRIYFSGFVSHHKINEWMAAGDLYVFCSHHEGMPRVVLEYMAMGKPVISTPVGGICEVIDDGVNGLITETAAPDLLVENIKKILDGDFNGSLLGAKARKTVEDNHDLESTISEQVAIYKRLSSGESVLKSGEHHL